MTFDGEERDNYREQQFHKTYDPDCSTCFSENVQIERTKDEYDVYIEEETGGLYKVKREH